MRKPRMNFDTFVKVDSLRNAWIYERDIAIYVRRSIRFINNQSVKCLDIGSVEVVEKRRGKGVFTAFLSRFEKEAKKLNRAVFVESILEPRLVRFFIQRGYSRHPQTLDFCPSMFKTFS